MTHLQQLPVVALVTTGRTGSDFLQSLLDSHPQIATFNGHFAIYSEFFSESLAFKVPGAQATDAADEFVGQYLYKLVSLYDTQEAKDCLGEDSNQSFRIDTALFKSHVVGLMGDLQLNSRNFLLAVYGAYSLCLGQKIEEFRILFHHPHLDYELKLFVVDFPKTRVIFSSRDPRANFCSHVEHFRDYYKSHDNQQHIFNCLKMALEDSQLADELGLDYTAIRLEDLPREDILRELATWLGVEYRESMLRSTWAGLDWHGDRISAKKFSATGWHKTRAENGWQYRLGWVEKSVLNYITHNRLRWYGYPVTSTGLMHAILVAILIFVPFRCERRLMSPAHILDVWRYSNRGIKLQHLLTIPFLLRRISLCYRFYWQTLNNVPFRRNWLRGKAGTFS
jgi:hypothetical protein